MIPLQLPLKFAKVIGAFLGLVVFATPGLAQRSDPVNKVVLELYKTPAQQSILPGATTSGMTYTGKIVDGTRGNLQRIPGSYFGPTIRVNKGDELSIRVTNNLTEPSVTHWHGLDVPASMDGSPSDVVAPGSSYNVSFPIINRAGTYWYHPHPDMRTAPQVYAGLAGFLIVDDPIEKSLGLPTGAYDVPLCIQDATFDANNQRVYNPMMIPGFFGSTILTNGRPNYVHSTATRAHRLRILNGSVSRILKLAFSDGTPMIAIGTDGGLLDVPRTYPYIMLAPGERVELWANFTGKTLGSQITLQSKSFSSNGGQGAAIDLMKFSIDRAETETKVLPTILSEIKPLLVSEAVNTLTPKVYPINAVGVNPNMTYTMNGGIYDPSLVATNERAQCGTVELVTVTNVAGMPIIPHPIHFHGRQFQMLDRSVLPGNLNNWNTIKDGLMMHGWKDTFLIMPGETVRFLVRYSNYPGRFLYHCHNLEHEDMGMMRNFELSAGTP